MPLQNIIVSLDIQHWMEVPNNGYHFLPKMSLAPGWNATKGVDNVHTLVCVGKPTSDDQRNNISVKHLNVVDLLSAEQTQNIYETLIKLIIYLSLKI